MITIHNTVDSEKIQRLSKEAIDLNFDDTEIKICAVGKLLKNKGFDRLVHIQKLLKEKGYRSHFYFIGEGSLRAEIESYCLKHGLESTVTLLGFLNNPFPYMRRCDLFVCASLQEGYSTATTEALILGLPVLTTNVSGMSEMLGNNNDYGIITENSEKALLNGLLQLLDRPGMLEHYKKMAQIRGMQFSTQNLVAETEHFIEDILAS